MCPCVRCRLTTQAQRPGAQNVWIATATLTPGSLERMVRLQSRHHKNLPTNSLSRITATVGLVAGLQNLTADERRWTQIKKHLRESASICGQRTPGLSYQQRLPPNVKLSDRSRDTSRPKTPRP